jgi:arylsulfatase A-like enzyme
MVVSYPNRIKDNVGLRSQFSHVTDIVPTILEVTGITFPDVLNGVTMFRSGDDSAELRKTFGGAPVVALLKKRGASGPAAARFHARPIATRSRILQADYIRSTKSASASGRASPFRATQT